MEKLKDELGMLQILDGETKRCTRNAFEEEIKTRMLMECCKFGFHIDLEVIKTFEIIVKTGLKCLKQT